MNKPTVLDLYAGCGGLSLGLKNAGFQTLTMVERDKWACLTLKENFKKTEIIEDSVQNFYENYKSKKYDVITGGPPCQGFSIAASNRRIPKDKRNEEYISFFKVCFSLLPKVIIMENVPEIIKFKNQKGLKIIEDISNQCKNFGYTLSWNIIKVANYGIPQKRKRFFLVALKGNKKFKFPPQTHSEKGDLLTKPYLTINDAISDLPEVHPKQHDEDDVIDYKEKPNNFYQRNLRGDSKKLHNHISMRHTDKTVNKFENIRNNASKSSFDQNHRLIKKEQPSPTITASFYSSFIHFNQNRNLTVREAARIQTFPDKFIFKGKKTTLSKSLLRKKGIFSELHLDQFNQVGNAVPPKFAEILGNHIKGYL